MSVNVQRGGAQQQCAPVCGFRRTAPITGNQFSWAVHIGHQRHGPTVDSFFTEGPACERSGERYGEISPPSPVSASTMKFCDGAQHLEAALTGAHPRTPAFAQAADDEQRGTIGRPFERHTDPFARRLGLSTVVEGTFRRAGRPPRTCWLARPQLTKAFASWRSPTGDPKPLQLGMAGKTCRAEQHQQRRHAGGATKEQQSAVAHGHQARVMIRPWR